MTGGILLLAALALGQSGPPLGQTGPPLAIPGSSAADAKPADSLGGTLLPPIVDPPAKPVEIDAPLLPAPPAPAAEEPAAESSAAAPDRWFLMRELQGTGAGAMLDSHRMFVTGWFNMAYNVSSSENNNQPYVWDDRANSFLFQQAWLRFGRSVVTSGTTDVTFGFQVDLLYGSDYRFTLPRGLWNSQLQNAEGVQSLYGIDPIQHYVSMYVPTLFNGTEFRVGRLYTPWGIDSLEAVSTPLISHSYAFNWAPPFTQSGVGAYITFSPEWSSVLMAVNGNDVYFGDPSEEWRFVGNVKWTQPGGRNTVTLAGTLGRGKFNAGDTYSAPTLALANEPLGRNNLNAVDVVWTHAFTSRFSYNVEAIFGWQTNVPGIFNAAGGGTATWAALAHYFFYTFSPEVSGIFRFENFGDFQGQRTGFEGMYSAVTCGVQYKPRKDLFIRTEARYDYNSETRPFEGKHGQAVWAADVTLRW